MCRQARRGCPPSPPLMLMLMLPKNAWEQPNIYRSGCTQERKLLRFGGRRAEGGATQRGMNGCHSFSTGKQPLRPTETTRHENNRRSTRARAGRPARGAKAGAAPSEARRRLLLAVGDALRARTSRAARAVRVRRLASASTARITSMNSSA